MQNQLRLSFGAIVGFDFTAVFAMAEAAGVCPVALAEWLPGIEAIAVAELNKRMKESGDD